MKVATSFGSLEKEPTARIVAFLWGSILWFAVLAQLLYELQSKLRRGGYEGVI